MIKFVKDKEPIWDTDNFDVLLIGTSIYNRLDGGFQSKIKFKYPIVDEENNKTKYADVSKLGSRLTVGTTPKISLMYICNYPTTKQETLDYDALDRCLKTANAEFKGKKVLMTIVGSSEFDGNGDRDKCLKLIEENTKDLDVTIYDYEQKKRSVEIALQKRYLKNLKSTDKEKYEQLLSVFDLYLKKLYLNG
jgi:hypothetical protein